MSEAAEVADAILRHVAEWYVRKDVNAAQVEGLRRDIVNGNERIMDRFDAQDQRLKNLEAESKQRRSTASGAMASLLVGVAVGVIVALVIKAIGG